MTHFDYNIFNITAIFVICFCFVATISFWTVLKSLLLQAQDAEYKFDFLRLKKNPHIFNARFNEFTALEMDFSDSDLIVGNPNAKIAITTVINTRCGPCARAHRKIKEILTEFPDHVRLVIRFTTGKQNEEETHHLIELYRTKGQDIFSRALDEWFDNRNYTLLTKEYPVNSITTETYDVLRKQLEWSDKCHITATPTIILDNKKVEKEYDIDDVRWLVHNQISERT